MKILTTLMKSIGPPYDFDVCVGWSDEGV